MRQHRRMKHGIDETNRERSDRKSQEYYMRREIEERLRREEEQRREKERQELEKRIYLEICTKATKYDKLQYDAEVVANLLIIDFPHEVMFLIRQYSCDETNSREYISWPSLGVCQYLAFETSRLARSLSQAKTDAGQGAFEWPCPLCTYRQVGGTHCSMCKSPQSQ
eukprot:g52383.t1